jgi:DNA-binding PadR family transcriptional regulator
MSRRNKQHIRQRFRAKHDPFSWILEGLDGQNSFGRERLAKHHEHNDELENGSRTGRGEGRQGGRREGYRFFGRGDVKYALLELLAAQPMHGYEMIKALETRSGGIYTPSAGTIYPVLQVLVEKGYVITREENGKKIHQLTEAGHQKLSDHQQQLGKDQVLSEEGQAVHDPSLVNETSSIRGEIKELIQLFKIAGRLLLKQPSYTKQLTEIISQTSSALTALIKAIDESQDK